MSPIAIRRQLACRFDRTQAVGFRTGQPRERTSLYWEKRPVFMVITTGGGGWK